MVLPRPFLKWVGGKGQLLPELLARVDCVPELAKARYYEPFVGGGALFFELVRTGRLGRKKAVLSDNNLTLIDTYTCVRDDVDAVIDLLVEHKARHGEEYFYQVRERVPEDRVEQAARIIYLNKTCYNGLFRVNSKGLFNAPFGRYKNPAICDEPNLRAVSEALKRATLKHRPFESVLKHAEPGDVVYFDPPYHPVSKTASFTGYGQNGFGEAEQRCLADVCETLHRRDVWVMLSNSDAPFIWELYKDRGLHLSKVYATRNVNSRGDLRGKVVEALVANLKLPTPPG
jgi:DNA adenine methylase